MTSSITSVGISISVTAQSVGPQFAGFGIPLILSHTATWSQRIRFYNSTLGVAGDFPVTSAEYMAAAAMFDQNPAPAQIAIGRGANKPTQRYTVSAASLVASDSADYGFNVVMAGVVSPQTVTYTTGAAPTIQQVHSGLVTALNGATTPNYTAAFAASPFTNETFSETGTNNQITVTAHGLSTGDGPFQCTTTGTLPSNIATLTNYWAVVVDANHLQLATSLANAIAATPTVITINTTGTGTQTINSNSALSPVLPFTVTANAAGNWFSLELLNVNVLNIAQTHADPGVVADLTAIQTANSTWYALTTLSNSNAMVMATAAWAQGAGIIYVADVNETNAIQVGVGGGTDSADDCHTLAYTRTAISYHSSPANFFSSAWLGRMLPINPGQDDWKWRTLVGVEPMNLSATQCVNLRAKACNTYQLISGLNVTWEGTVASGGFIDTTRDFDWLANLIQTSIFAIFPAVSKVPMTDSGIAQVENVLRGCLQQGIQAGVLAATPAPVVTAPLAANIPIQDLIGRILPNVNFSAIQAGSIHAVQMNGVVAL